MRFLLLVWAWAITAVFAQAQAVSAPPTWNPSPSAAEKEALDGGRPVLLLWQAGPGAAVFTRGVERLFTSWPVWALRVSTLVVAARGRSWEAPLAATIPLPARAAKASALVLWKPGANSPPVVWTEVPPILELSRRVAEVSGSALEDPYSVNVVDFSWEEQRLTRLGRGPGWSFDGEAGAPQWIEEGPLGGVLVLRELATGRRAAFPLEGDWSFLYDPTAQNWTPWRAVLVKRR